MSGSTITGSGTLSYNSGTSTFSYTGAITLPISWPITITNSNAPTTLTVTFGTDLTLITNQYYFIINGDNVTIEGNNKTVTIAATGNNYIGLVKNGDSISPGLGKLTCNIQNIAVVNNETATISACIAQDYFGNFASGSSTSSITNCSVTTKQGIDNLQGAIVGSNNFAIINNCYVIVGGGIGTGGGIVGEKNLGAIINCYAIVGGVVTTGGGIAGQNNNASITNCYAIVGGNVLAGGGGIVGTSNLSLGIIRNCYAILGGTITGSGGIAGTLNAGTISSCYVNHGYSPGIAPPNIFVGSNTSGGSVIVATCGSGGTANWTTGPAIGASYLIPSRAWTSYNVTKPYLLSAYATAVTSSTTVNTTSGILGLTTYGSTLVNGTVTSTQGETWSWSTSGIGYSNLSTVTYQLNIYANDLLSDLYGSSPNFFTNDNSIETAFNVSPTTGTANTIVPYAYSNTTNVSITYAADIMSTITGSGVLTYNGTGFSYSGAITNSSGSGVAFPISITNTSGSILTVTFGSNLTLSEVTDCFIISPTSTNGVTIEGSNYVVTVPTNYLGLVQNGPSTFGIDGVDNCKLQNMGLKTTGDIYNGIAQDYFGKGNTTCSITNCNVNVVGNIMNYNNETAYGGGIAGRYNTAVINNCYSVVGGINNSFNGGIVGRYNAGAVTNCYTIVGGNIGSGPLGGSGAGIVGGANASTGSITNCYAIVGGYVGGGGISCDFNKAAITNCYAIVGGNIQNGGGGIACHRNSGTITNCYSIVGGQIDEDSGSIVGEGNDSTTISNCYVSVSNATDSNYVAPGTGVRTVTNCDYDNDAKWTSGSGQGASYLSPTSAWKIYDTTKPYMLSAFASAVTSSGSVNSSSGTLGLTLYGSGLVNGTVISPQGGSWTWSNSGIEYGRLSSTTYSLNIEAYNLLSDLTTFSFTNDDAIERAFNVTPTGISTANTIVPYEYSNTSNVSITYAAYVVCFLEGSEILTSAGYVKIEELLKTDLIFTSKSGFKKIYKIGRQYMKNAGVEDRLKDQLYVCEKKEFGLTKDLILTGCHGILVDSLTEEDREETKKILGSIYLTEGKYKLPACRDKRTKVYPKGKYMIYHIALENDNNLSNYGIYANGLLVETCCKYTMDRSFSRNSVKNVESVDLRKMSISCKF